MSFRLFIYYCSLCGAWGAFVTALVAIFVGLLVPLGAFSSTALTASVLGLMLGFGVGAVDAMLNSVRFERLLRIGLCSAIGLVGGLASGLIAEGMRWALGKVPVIGPVAGDLRFYGWVLVGMTIGASVGIFDIGRALLVKAPVGPSIRKTVNGVIGGFVGGLLGGIVFDAILKLQDYLPGPSLGRTVLTVALVILGACVGVMIGVAQVVLKEAWLKVERGFRPGREMMLNKEEFTIGRAENCDIGLFGDNAIEKLHARILRQNNEYVVADNNSASGTFLNDRRVTAPTPLQAGDLIRVGNSYLRFGEKAKRK